MDRRGHGIDQFADVRRAADLITIFVEREYRIEPPHGGPPEFYTIKNWLAQLVFQKFSLLPIKYIRRKM